MALKYTDEQKKIIYDRGRSILVSAAAGSGKTAVLVQRIIQKITHSESPVSIDALLIVTFTNAAAAEMRERISLAIEEAIETAEDEAIIQHLVRQLTLMATANIMTLHSFCLQILKNYYYLLELDPNFRIGNETELVLMMEECLDEIFEEEYERKSDAFLRVVDGFSQGNDDQKIRDIVLAIYRFSRSHPRPEQWMDQAVQKLDVKNRDEIYKSDFFRVMKANVLENLRIAQSLFPKLHELMALEGGPDKYKDTVGDLEMLHRQYVDALDMEEMEALKKAYQDQFIAPLSRKSKGYDKALAAEAKNIIEQIKESLSVVGNVCFDAEDALEGAQVIHDDIQEFTRLTQRFAVSFSEAKYDKGLIDFSDIEHFALALLYDNGSVSEIGKRFQEMFHEVLVDEYQDINEVQEAVIQAVSQQSKRKNLFMVGDVKQSIYKFRLARPEIFSQKYRRFSYDHGEAEKADEIKIDLAKNFRSRQSVLNFANYIFEGIMSEQVGDVRYDEKTQLNYGASFYTTGNEATIAYCPEILIIEDPKEGESKSTLQAQFIGNKIQEIVEGNLFKVNGENGEQRSATYEDICILMRSPSRAMEDIKEVFDQKGIPYGTDISTGFFDAIEVQVILNVLKVIDNPLQDIPLVSVLRAPFIGFDEKELMILKKMDPTLNFYGLLQKYQEIHAIDTLVELGTEELEKKEEPDSVLLQKVCQFIELYQRLHEASKYLELYELIQRIYLETGYKNYVRFMDNGSQRMQNLEFLLEQGAAFEASSYKGVFNFVRYIEHMKKYNVASPEPHYASEIENRVTLMSIHKSKGLEFPIVFIMDLQKQFNEMDLREPILMHQDLGMTCDYIDVEQRTRQKHFFSEALRVQGKNELVSEEIRILYVALTRAKEKLYLIGTTLDYDKNIEKMTEKFGVDEEKPVPPALVEKARSYLELILMRCHSESNYLYTRKKVEYTSIVEEEAFYQLNQTESKFELKEMLLQGLSHEAKWAEELEKYQDVVEAPYAYEASTKKYLSLSVSEIKRKRQALSEAFHGGEEELLVKTPQEPVPEFMQEEKEEKGSKGATYGTLIHLLLSKLDFRRQWTYNEVKKFVYDLAEKKHITEEEKAWVPLSAIHSFTQSPLYQRICDAGIQAVYRERPFVLQIDDDGDGRMIQGVIDLFFLEEDAWVLVDYKTDYISPENTSQLIERYALQLTYYKKALEQMTGKKVKETLIYSLSLNKTLSVDIEGEEI